MILATLDTIVRRWLLENGLPIHYYGEGLFHASTCLRELSFDTLLLVNAFGTPVDDVGSFYLPDDFEDDVSVCVPQGGILMELPKQNNLNPTRLHSATTGEYLTYESQSSIQTTVTFDFPYNGWTWFWNVNTFGEPTGRMYGAAGGVPYGYTLIRKERRIQLSESFAGTNVVLLYTSGGQSVDNATQIELKAFATINAFIAWKTSPNKNNPYSPEAKNFDNQKRLLRARLDDLTKTDILNIVRNSYQAGIKN